MLKNAELNEVVRSLQTQTDTLKTQHADLVRALAEQAAASQATNVRLDTLFQRFDTTPHHTMASSPSSPAAGCSPSTGLLPRPPPLTSTSKPLDPEHSHHLRSMKLEVPRFDGSDPHTWLSRVERFFDFHGTPAHL